MVEVAVEREDGAIRTVMELCVHLFLFFRFYSKPSTDELSLQSPLPQRSLLGLVLVRASSTRADRRQECAYSPTSLFSSFRR
jgi:hypothetical protein